MATERPLFFPCFHPLAQPASSHFQVEPKGRTGAWKLRNFARKISAAPPGSGGSGAQARGSNRGGKLDAKSLHLGELLAAYLAGPGTRMGPMGTPLGPHGPTVF